MRIEIKPRFRNLTREEVDGALARDDYLVLGEVARILEIYTNDITRRRSRSKNPVKPLERKASCPIEQAALDMLLNEIQASVADMKPKIEQGTESGPTDDPTLERMIGVLKKQGRDV